MSSDIRIIFDASNFNAVKRAVDKLASQGYYRGQIKEVIVAMLDVARMYAEGITHVWSGLLKRSHRTEYDSHRMIGSLYVDPTRMGATGRVRVAEYAVYEHARGGTHAFYERTYNTLGAIWAITGVRIAIRELERL